jgi:hypothetical protein
MPRQEGARSASVRPSRRGPSIPEEILGRWTTAMPHTHTDPAGAFPNNESLDRWFPFPQGLSRGRSTR